MLIIDAYNLLHAAAGRRGKVTGLSLNQFCSVCRGMKLTLVMDGVRKPHEPQVGDYEALDLKWAGCGRSADDAIIALCKASTGRRDICVVTDDRQLRSRAETLGVRTLHCGTFLQQVYTHRRQENRKQEPLAKQMPTPSAVETRFWMKVFGFMPTDDDDTSPSGVQQSPKTSSRRMDRELTESEIDAIDMRTFLD
ncbi:MAG: NYN domain-containing protein [Phycisphaerae bacterium]